MKNESGLHPTGDMVLVKLLPVAEMSSGGIAMTQDHIDREMMGQIYGIVVEMGDVAPTKARMKGVTLGTLVMFARYAGLYETGPDGAKYRLVRADDIAAIRDKPPVDRPVAHVSSTRLFDIA